LRRRYISEHAQKQPDDGGTYKNMPPSERAVFDGFYIIYKIFGLVFPFLSSQAKYRLFTPAGTFIVELQT